MELSHPDAVRSSRPAELGDTPAHSTKQLVSTAKVHVVILISISFGL
jgi:hypothetical protein